MHGTRYFLTLLLSFVLTTVYSPVVAAQSLNVTLVGTWLGSLEVPGGRLRVILNIASEGDEVTATMDSPDQGVRGIRVASVSLDSGRVLVDVPAVGGGFDGSLLPDGNTINGVWMQRGMKLALELKRVDSVETPNRPQQPNPPFPYESLELGFENTEADVHLGGTLTLPAGKGPFPAVVLVSGSGPQDRDETIAGHRPFFVLADYLTRRGVAVLRFDDRGVGESTGNVSQATTHDFVGDALTVLRALKDRTDIDPLRIGMIGHSEGGIVAAIAAATTDDVAFIVMMAGTGLPGQDIILRQSELILRANGASESEITENAGIQRRLFAIVMDRRSDTVNVEALNQVLQEHFDTLDVEARSRMGMQGDAADAYIRMQATQLSTPWFRTFLTLDPRLWLKRIDKPVLVIIGEKDLQVPADENLAAIEGALTEGRHAMTRIVKLPGLNHLFQTATSGSPSEYARIEETIAPIALEMIGDWIRDVVGAENGR